MNKLWTMALIIAVAGATSAGLSYIGIKGSPVLIEGDK